MNEKEIDTRSEPAEETDPMKSKDVVEAVKTGQYCRFCDAEISEVLAKLGRHICEPDCHSTDFGADTRKPDKYITLPSESKWYTLRFSVLKDYTNEDFQNPKLFYQDRMCSHCGHHLPLDQATEIVKGEFVHDDRAICAELGGYCQFCGDDTSDELAYLGVHMCGGG